MSKHSKQSKQNKKHSQSITKPKDQEVKDQEVKDQEVKDQEAITTVTTTKPTGEVVETVQDNEGNMVLTVEDKAKIEAVKALQVKAKQAKIDAKKAVDDAKEAIQALSGSEAIKSIKLDIEARLKDQEAITEKALTEYQEAKSKLNSIQEEYKALTGIDKASKASNGKVKASNGSAQFETVVKQETDSLKVLVTHKDTKSLFEYDLFFDNGSISREAWLKLRAVFMGQFTKDTDLDNLTLRAYLSNLKGKVEAVKSISK